LISAEACRAYSNLDVPPLDTFEAIDDGPDPTLVDQSSGLAKLKLSVDAEPAETNWRSVQPFMREVVGLYLAGYSLSAVSRKLGISWDSVAGLLDQADARARNRRHPLA
jgi:hypothetical protein